MNFEIVQSFIPLMKSLWKNYTSYVDSYTLKLFFRPFAPQTIALILETIWNLQSITIQYFTSMTLPEDSQDTTVLGKAVAGNKLRLARIQESQEFYDKFNSKKAGVGNNDGLEQDPSAKEAISGSGGSPAASVTLPSSCTFTPDTEHGRKCFHWILLWGCLSFKAILLWHKMSYSAG